MCSTELCLPHTAGFKGCGATEWQGNPLDSVVILCSSFDSVFATRVTRGKSRTRPRPRPSPHIAEKLPEHSALMAMYVSTRVTGRGKMGCDTYVCTPLHVATRMNTHLRPQPKYGESLEPKQRHHLLLHYYCSTKWQTGASLAQESSLSHRVLYNALILLSSVPPVPPVQLEFYNNRALKAEVSIR